MQIIELKKVPSHKIGRVNRNNVKTEPGEDSTFLYLTQFGFDIEIIKPAISQRTKNPDILMLGTIWEVKMPTSSNESTIKTDFRKASKQSTKIIFDLRGIKRDADKIEKYIIKLFDRPGRVNRMILVKKNGVALDIFK